VSSSDGLSYYLCLAFQLLSCWGRIEVPPNKTFVWNRRSPYSSALGVEDRIHHVGVTMKHRFVIISAALALLGCSPPPQAIEATVALLPETWAAAFNECSAAKFAGLYHPVATLWGTNANSLTTAPEGVRFYFDQVCAMQPPVKVTIGERTTQVFGEAATSSGTYTFVRGEKSFPARFSFAYLRADGKWLIVQHHSSLMPGTP